MANTLTFANQIITDANIYGGINYLVDLNTGEEFSIGNAASASISFVTDLQLPLYSKDSINGTFTWTQDNTARGRYYITEVVKENNMYTVTAYDAVILLDAKITELALTYPLTVSAAASAIASYIGCTVSGTVNNSTCSVDELSDDLAIRDLLSYVAEASGCSVKINGSDELCFMYYEDSGVELSASDYKRLELADYTCAPIDNVTILSSIGSTVASSGEGTNTLYIEGNPFLENATAAEAAAILAIVGGFSYVPLTCELFDDDGIEVGTIVKFVADNTLMDALGDPLEYEEGGVLDLIASYDCIPLLVMHVESSEEGAVISSVGNNDRAEYNKSYEVLIADASTKATKYITRVGDDGIKVHAEDNIDVNYAQIDANGMEVYKGGESVAQYGDSARIGKTGSGHTTIQASGMQIYGYDGTVELANIGYGTGNAQSGTADAPYYTLGRRFTGAIGNYSMAEGLSVIASGFCSHAEGNTNTASGNYSHAEGNGNTASGDDSHAEGFQTTASGSHSHAEGRETTASGSRSHAEGYITKAVGNSSHAGGFKTIANGDNQTVIGKYNVADSTSLFIVGNGTGDNARANAFKVDANGNTTVGGHDSAIGTRTSDNSSTSIASGSTYTQLSSAISLTAGTWLLIGGADFPANATGVRRLGWYDSGGSLYNASAVTVPSAGSAYDTRIQSTCTISVNNSLDMYLYCSQNSGSSMTVNYYYQVVRIA